jgi:integrase/recombinase XerC
VVPDVPSDDDVDALLAAAKTEREAAVLSLLMNGLRASEVANLPEDSVKWTKEYGYYLIVTGKGNKTRIVPLLPDTIQRLQDFDRANGATSAWLVHNTDGGKLTYDMVNGIVDMAARKSKVDIHPHSLRHHYATRLIRAGANVFAVKDLLGHASVATTQQYVKMDITALVEATSLDPRNAGGIKLVPTRRIEPVREEVSWLAAS